MPLTIPTSTLDHRPMTKKTTCEASSQSVGQHSSAGWPAVARRYRHRRRRPVQPNPARRQLSHSSWRNGRCNHLWSTAHTRLGSYPKAGLLNPSAFRERLAVCCPCQPMNRHGRSSRRSMDGRRRTRRRTTRCRQHSGRQDTPRA